MDEVRVTDLYHMMATLGYNPRARRFLVERFKGDYELVNKKYEGNYDFQEVIEVCADHLSERSNRPALMGMLCRSTCSATCRQTGTTRTPSSSSRLVSSISDARSSSLTIAHDRTRTPKSSRSSWTWRWRAFRSGLRGSSDRRRTSGVGLQHIRNKAYLENLLNRYESDVKYLDLEHPGKEITMYDVQRVTITRRESVTI